MSFSIQLVLHRVKSQDNRVSERKGQIESNPHCTEKLYHQKTNPTALCVIIIQLRTIGITQIFVQILIEATIRYQVPQSELMCLQFIVLNCKSQ